MRYLQQLVIRIGLEIMRAFFEHLKKKNILSRSGVDKRSIEKLSKMKIIDLSEQLLDICSSVEEKRQPTTFKHFSSLSLGGGIEECASLECRLKKIDQLARFAVLYSNKVYIRNFLGDYEHLKNEPKIELLERLFNDLCIIWYIRPLIEKGHISLLSPIKHMCPYCFVEHYRLEPTLGGRLIRVQRKLAQQYLANTSLNIVKLGDKYGIEARGPETLYEHGFAGVILRKLPECLKRRTRLLEKLETQNELEVSKTFQKELKHHNSMANKVTQNICYELAANKTLGTSFVTHNPLHISVLEMLTNDSEIERCNKIAFENLTTNIPFLSDVSVRNLLKLRQREQESFVVFRTALNEAIVEFANRRKEFTRNTACELYGDVIAPRLAKLDRRVRKAKTDLEPIRITRSNET
ncbi:hypothetical protein ES703_96141 [subsurface metagenome]